ncbi:Oxysterol-binding protein 1 [Geodia barretti]|uniref:Oxysterol-binding protein n=1 Tax=Geodia barretti TaxID=519541 RepID=A0AA35S6P5_GEOBA|nr:Oxysterol-binding protein 1 [Geodia barretti]
MAYPEHFRGWLLKWTNYIKGYQKRWFVLSNGLLSYYRAQEEMAHTCRGTVNLSGAFIDNIDSTNFVITNGPQVYYLRASSEVERQRWVTALTLAKAKAVKDLESESDGEGEMVVVREVGGGERGRDEGMTQLRKKMKELSAAHDVIVRNSQVLLKQITTEVEGSGSGHLDPTLKENLSLFRLIADAMVKASEGYLLQARSVEKRWRRDMQSERDLRLRLQENMETMANQIHGLENDAKRSVGGGGRGHRSASQGSREVVLSPSAATDTGRGESVQERGRDTCVGGEEGERGGEGEEEMFFDAHEISAEEWAKATRAEFTSQSSTGSGRIEGPMSGADDRPPFNETSMEDVGTFSKVPQSFHDRLDATLPIRRTTIPPKPNVSFNLWSFVKNSVGKDLTKLPMPVSINQPLSFLQRMVEDLVYADSLSAAVAGEGTLEELTHVAAFACSVYAQTSSNAITKPFNPLLGETFECDRRAESGWRCLLEQVSHHPPMFAMHVEHKDWTLWEEYTVASKFRGKGSTTYVSRGWHLFSHTFASLIQSSNSNLVGSHYTWTKVVTTVHNIIIGNMWIDQSGPMKVTNHKTGEEAVLNFHAYAYFTRERQRKVSHAYSHQLRVENLPLAGDWPGSEAMYGFSEFACGLNEPEEGVAPTDSRLRPDQRIMEKGDFDTANNEKLRLEEKQRAKRREREEAVARAAAAAADGDHEEATRLERVATYSPLWFRKEFDSVTNSMMHMYRGGYWEGKNGGWRGAEFPDIF